MALTNYDDLSEEIQNFLEKLEGEFGTEDIGKLYLGALLVLNYPHRMAALMNEGSKLVVQELEAAGMPENAKLLTVEGTLTDIENIFGPRERTSEEVEAYTGIAFNKD